MDDVSWIPPFEEAEVGHRIGDDFAELMKGVWERKRIPMDGLPSMSDPEVHRGIFDEIDVRSVGNHGRTMIRVRGNRQEGVERRVSYAISPARDIMFGARLLASRIALKAEEIAREHCGRPVLWSGSIARSLRIIDYVSDDSPGEVSAMMIRGVQHVVLRAIYYPDWEERRAPGWLQMPSDHPSAINAAREDYLPVMGIYAASPPPTYTAPKATWKSLDPAAEAFMKGVQERNDAAVQAAQNALALKERAIRECGVRELAPTSPAMECNICCIPGATAATGRCSHGHLYRSKVRESKPALYDGLTASACFERFVKRQHDSTPDRHELAMSSAQLDVAREMWSQELREKRAEVKPRLTIMVDQDIDE